MPVGDPLGYLQPNRRRPRRARMQSRKSAAPSLQSQLRLGPQQSLQSQIRLGERMLPLDSIGRPVAGGSSRQDMLRQTAHDPATGARLGHYAREVESGRIKPAAGISSAFYEGAPAIPAVQPGPVYSIQGENTVPVAGNRPRGYVNVDPGHDATITGWDGTSFNPPPPGLPVKPMPDISTWATQLGMTEAELEAAIEMLKQQGGLSTTDTNPDRVHAQLGTVATTPATARSIASGRGRRGGTANQQRLRNRRRR